MMSFSRGVPDTRRMMPHKETKFGPVNCKAAHYGARVSVLSFSIRINSKVAKGTQPRNQIRDYARE